MSPFGRRQPIETVLSKQLLGFLVGQTQRLGGPLHVDSGLVPLCHRQVGHEVFVDVDMLLFFLLLSLTAILLRNDRRD
jgi:hypothetical protein